jgi:hypothetical protein
MCGKPVLFVAFVISMFFTTIELVDEHSHGFLLEYRILSCIYEMEISK